MNSIEQESKKFSKKLFYLSIVFFCLSMILKTSFFRSFDNPPPWEELSTKELAATWDRLQHIDLLINDALPAYYQKYWSYPGADDLFPWSKNTPELCKLWIDYSYLNSCLAKEGLLTYSFTDLWKEEVADIFRNTSYVHNTTTNSLDICYKQPKSLIMYVYWRMEQKIFMDPIEKWEFKDSCFEIISLK